MAVFAALAALAFAIAPCHAFYGTGSAVVTLTPDNFDDLVVQDDSVWMVEFYAPWCGHCKSLTPEYTKFAAATTGAVKVGAVDADKHKSLGGRYGVQGFPTIKLFGADKKSPADYSGERTAKAMADAAIRELKSMVTQRLSGGGSKKKKEKKSNKTGGSGGKVIELTEDNFDELVLNSGDAYLVSFTAPWCGHCKNLKPAWSEAATQLGGKVKIANVDATVHQGLAQRFNVNGYPTIKAFHGSGSSRTAGVPYQGGREAQDIVAYALTIAPPTEVLELVSPEDFKACETQTCIVAILPDLYTLDADGRKGLVKILKKAAKKSADQPLGWFWTSPGEQKALQEALMPGSSAFPAVWALDVIRKRATRMLMGLDQDNLDRFIIGLMTGKAGQVQPMGSLPSVVKSTKWDGKDAPVVAVDEISLDELFGDDEDDEL